MAARETAAQRKTRISLLLADYDSRSRELNKLTAIVKGLREQVRELEAGAFGDWRLSYGAPRQILNQAKAKQMLTDAGLEVPMVETAPSIVVSPQV